MARKILLADDSVTAQNMGRKILADAGYEVITVNNGSAALKKISETRPDLIVLDVYMPGYSGLEVCQRLKEAQETSRIPVLLTVGKLEPFKPEEAKRVRADAYIVKPFEASELLSALTKLEDKIVPRAEASKPGRFARNIAAIEEGRYDSTVANDQDSGWKNRIGFPSGKKEKAGEPEDVNDPAIYNPVNKDLRTVVEIPSVHAPAPPEGHVDLGALAAQGLPTEVTPEEIAALAAAAAQVKKSIASKNGDEAAPHAPEGVSASAPHELPAEPRIEAQNVETGHSTAGIVDIAATSEASGVPEAPSGLAAEMPQAIASQVVPGNDAPDNVAPGNEPYPDSTGPYAEEPVTMAAAAGAGSSRWSAVAVALAPEEIGISLESEMQKAYAAFAAAEMAHSESVAVQPEPSAPAPEPQITNTAIPESSPAAEPASLHELTHTVSEIAAVANDAMSAAATELEATASSHIGSAPVELAPVEPAPVEPAPAISYEATAYPAPDVPAAMEEAPSQPPAPEAVNAGDSARLEPTAGSTENAPLAPAHEPASIPEIAQAPQESAPTIPVDQHAIEATATDAAAMTDSQAEPAPEGRVEVAKKESEIAEHTAAAWASWRRIRETGDSHSSHSTHEEQESGQPEDAAAMAVAAGAERAPEDVSSTSESESAEIASIVDSVLADLRPKIVEEISRKLAKKK